MFRSPLLIVQNREQSLDGIENNLAQKAHRFFGDIKLRIETLAAKLIACNPGSVLNRGYSIAKNAATGKIIANAADINIGDLMITEFANEKIIESKITKK